MLKEINNCTGCNACYSICKFGAISIVLNNQGFSYPKCDYSKCVNCGLCDKVCHVINPNHLLDYFQKAYAVLNKDTSIQNKSSSAGAFYLIASNIIHDGGVVYGAAWTGKYSVSHLRIDTIEQLELLQKSKYIQSDMHQIYNDVHNDLINRRKVLFSGTPCQVAGLKSFLRCDYDNLLLIDVVCHGVPSKTIYQLFINYEERKKYIEITNYDFRYKMHNKANYITAIKYKFLGKHFVRYEPWFGTSYGYFFMNGYTLRECCYTCKYAKREREGDITLGDFWNVRDLIPNINERNGVGLVIINSCKGDVAFSAISEKIKMFECNIEEAVKRNPQMNNPTIRPEGYEFVMKNIKMHDYSAIQKYYKSLLSIGENKKRLRFKISLRIYSFIHRFK